MVFSLSHFITLIEIIIAELIFLFPYPKKRKFFLRYICTILVVASLAAFIPEEIKTGIEWLDKLYVFLKFMALFFASVGGMLCCFNGGFPSVLSACAAGYATEFTASRTSYYMLLSTGLGTYLTETGIPSNMSAYVSEAIFFPIVYLIVFVSFGLFAQKMNFYKESSTSTNILSIAMVMCCIGISRFDSRERMFLYTVALCLFAIFFQFVVHRALSLKSENELIYQVIEMERKQYEASKANIDLINMQCHDLKHKLNDLKGRLPQEEIDSMRKTIESFDSNIKTGNEILDVLFAEKSLLFHAEKIKITCSGDGSVLSFMSAMDIYSLFGNALDNAIEASVKLPEEEKRIVSMVINKKGDIVVINITNYFLDPPKIENGKLITSKTSDPGNHGYGMKSMKAVAAKYHGDVSFSAEKDKFVLLIFLKAST